MICRHAVFVAVASRMAGNRHPDRRNIWAPVSEEGLLGGSGPFSLTGFPVCTERRVAACVPWSSGRSNDSSGCHHRRCGRGSRVVAAGPGCRVAAQLGAVAAVPGREAVAGRSGGDAARAVRVGARAGGVQVGREPVHGRGDRRHGVVVRQGCLRVERVRDRVVRDVVPVGAGCDLVHDAPAPSLISGRGAPRSWLGRREVLSWLLAVARVGRVVHACPVRVTAGGHVSDGVTS